MPWTSLGLPPVNASLSPNCAGLLGLPRCNETNFYEDFGNHHPIFAPFASPAYSNIGYSILGMVVEAASKMSYHAFVEKEIFKPLGLTHTTPADPPTANKTGFIPANDIWWGSNIGFESP